MFRNAVALKDPATQEVLGYEAQYVGQAELLLGESVQQSPDGKGGLHTDPVPATLNLLTTREEVRAGDRLLPAPERSFSGFVPHAPEGEMDARVVSIYGGSAFANAAQNQVVATGEAVLVCVDKQTSQKVNIPELIRNRIIQLEASVGHNLAAGE